jgi:molybdate transport system substrate-binding protein
MRKGVFAALWLALALALPAQAQGQDARIAVAANFTGAAKDIAAAFSRETGLSVDLIFGGAGALYSQIVQGAPFDALLSADATTPARLADVGVGVGIPGTLFTYAIGRLVLFSARDGLVSGPQALEGAFNHIAIAEPATAPYGAAAIEVLDGLRLLGRLTPKLVIGQNIAQAYQFVDTGNAELGFVALSQVINRDDGSRWIVPEALHAPIVQDAILLSEDNVAARAFLEFLTGDAARLIIEGYGYAVAD